MSHDQPCRSAALVRSRDWVLNQATEEELLEHLQQLLVARRAQHDELMALVEALVEEQDAMQDEMNQVVMEGWYAEDAPPRTSWVALGVAGLVGYLIGRSRG